MLRPSHLLPLRHRFMRSIRGWFEDQGFIEVETPYRVLSPGMEPHLVAIEVTSRETQERHTPHFLHTSPEYHMKRVLASHPAPIYQICRCYRDEPVSRLHHPEFTMLEWYRPHVDYRQLMDDCEKLLRRLAEGLLDEPVLRVPRGLDTATLCEVRLDVPVERISVARAFERWVGVDPFAHPDDEDFKTALRRTGLEIPSHWDWADTFHFALLERVEANLGLQGPTVLYDYPPSLAALARVRGGVAERFELYVGAVELANAFSELVDAGEQRTRFLAEREQRQRLGKPVYPIDEALLTALGQLPPTAGIALGLDRLWLLWAENELGLPLGLTEVLWLAG